MPYRKHGLLSSRSRSTNDSFATRLDLMVDRQKPKCPVEILDCCGQVYMTVSFVLSE